MLVDGSPQPMLLAGDADRNLIQVPFVTGCGQMPADLIGKALAKFQRPLPHSLMTDQDPAGREHLLDHAQTQWKPEVQPDGVADHFSREAVASIAGMAKRCHPSRMPRSGHLRVNLTVPFGLIWTKLIASVDELVWLQLLGFRKSAVPAGLSMQRVSCTLFLSPQLMEECQWIEPVHP